MTHLLIQGIIAFIAIYAFSILLCAPSKHYLYCGLTGAIGWFVNILLIEWGFSVVLSSFIATMALTMISRMFSVRRKAPVTVFLIAGIFPLVPGAGIYYTAYYVFAAELETALFEGLLTIKLAGAIVLGILFGFSIPQRFFNYLQKASAS